MKVPRAAAAQQSLFDIRLDAAVPRSLCEVRDHFSHGPRVLTALLILVASCSSASADNQSDVGGAGGISASSSGEGGLASAASDSGGSAGNSGGPSAGAAGQGGTDTNGGRAGAAGGSGGTSAMGEGGYAAGATGGTAGSLGNAGSAGIGGGASSPFVSVCGMSLCLKGQPFRIKGATAYGVYQDPNLVVQAAQAANINTIELVEFETVFHSLNDTMSEATWTRVDEFVATMSAAKLHVVFNLGSYGQSLQVAGKSAVATDWNDYLKFITLRTNTVSHVQYKNDPTIALIEIWGEIPPPNGQGTNGNTQQMTDFYHRTLSELATLDQNHVRSSGGFSYLDQPNSAGIDWKTIMNDPLDQVCAAEINSRSDRDITVPMVTSYCKGIAKPWFLAAWSSCIGQAQQFNGDLDSYANDDLGAAHAIDMYAIASNENVNGNAPAMSAIGSDFWNLGPGHAPTCDINTSFPKTLAVIKAAH